MKIARDKYEKIMWVKGRTDISPLTYREYREGADMTSGSILKNGIRYFPPFTLQEEEISDKALRLEIEIDATSLSDAIKERI